MFPFLANLNITQTQWSDVTEIEFYTTKHEKTLVTWYVSLDISEESVATLTTNH